MKTILVQLSVVPGDVALMQQRVIEHIADAREQGADLVVFPEMVYGYLLGDRWEDEGFLRDIETADRAIRDASHGLTVVWGSVVIDWARRNEDGRVRKYNAALVATHSAWANNGSPLQHWVPKTNMPKYRIFDDARHFTGAWKLAQELGVSLPELLVPFTVRATLGAPQRVGIMVCEDGWDDDYPHKVATLYRGRAELLIDMSHSPWTYEKRRARERMLAARASDAHMPILYVASVGLENNGKNLVLFDGGTCMVNDAGKIVWRARAHASSATLLDVAVPPPANGLIEPATGAAEVCEALLAATRLAYGTFPRVVVGLSGGVDSAVMLALLVEALGPERVLAVNMPSRFNSKTTRSLAREQARLCGVEYRTIPVGWLLAALRYTLRAFRLDGLVWENAQAVVRMAILNTVAQSVGGVFTNSGNDTETALGYFTLNGDGRGAYALMGNLPKRWVYALGRHLNVAAGRTLIPQGVFTVRPAAELSAAQNPEAGGGDPIFYPYHDPLIRAWREGRRDPSWVLEHLLARDLENALGCPQGTISSFFPSAEAFVENLEWAWRMYQGSVFKRVQAPPILIVFRRAFGFDLRESMVSGGVTFPDSYAALKERVLSERTLW